MQPVQTGEYGGAPMQLPHGPAWLRSPVGLGKAAAVAVGVAAATDLFAVWSGYVSYDVADRLVGDGFGAVPMTEVDRADTIYAATGVGRRSRSSWPSSCSWSGSSGYGSTPRCSIRSGTG
ncbi:hypothetical protein [Streptomyces tauricus]|uniref:hypothetical protein n=1 Tax=Streptomyces tauricus TaxID=68274 RepID=UPI00341C2CAB